MPAVDLDQLARAFMDLQLGVPVALTALEGGTAAVYRVDRRDAPAVVLKIYHDLRQSMPGKETYAARLLAGIDVPITRFLAFDESRRLLPYSYAVTNFLPGRAVGTFGAEPDVADLHRQMGALLRRLHSVRLPAFGHFDVGGIVDPVASNAEFVMALWGNVLQRFRDYGAAPALADRLDSIVAGGRDLLIHSGGAVFAHDDFQPNNVLANRDASGRLQLTGLIDFGNARAADAAFDLAKALFCCEHEAPGSTAAILDGYGVIDHPEPDAALWLYTLIHRVVMWYWLRHIGVIPDHGKHDLIVDLEAMAEEKRP
jgi:Ser/Thr protein kinase RdoA (MazF antagonist)